MQGNSKRTFLRPWILNKLNKVPHGLDCQWVDQEKGIFRLLWTHSGKPGWSKEQGSLFKDWAANTGKYQLGYSSDNYSKWKTNFRCAINKASDIKEIKQIEYLSDNNCNNNTFQYKYYQFLPKAMSQNSRKMLKSSPGSYVNSNNFATSKDEKKFVYYNSDKLQDLNERLVFDQPSSSTRNNHDILFSSFSKPDSYFSSCDVTKAIPIPVLEEEEEENIGSQEQNDHNKKNLLVAYSTGAPVMNIKLKEENVVNPVVQNLDANAIATGYSSHDAQAHRIRQQEKQQLQHLGISNIKTDTYCHNPSTDISHRPLDFDEDFAQTACEGNYFESNMPMRYQYNKGTLLQTQNDLNMHSGSEKDMKTLGVATLQNFTNEPHKCYGRLGHEMKIDLFYLDQKIQEWHCVQSYGCILFYKTKLTIPLNDMDIYYGRNWRLKEKYELTPWPQTLGNHKAMTKASEVLANSQRGISLSCQNGNIYIIRKCKAAVYSSCIYHNKITRGSEDRWIKIFDYEEDFLNQLESYRDNKIPEAPSSGVTLYIGQNGLHLKPKETLVKLQITSCKANSELKNIIQDSHHSYNVDISQSDVIDRLGELDIGA